MHTLRILVTIAACLLTYAAFSQTELPPTYSVDGRVQALETYGDTVIIGGYFGHVGKYTGGGALFSTTSDEPNLAFPKINGRVTASCPDGNGGFYIAGDYSHEGQTNNSPRIEHILPNMTFESSFSLAVSDVRDINKMLFDNGLLYMGGDNITQVGSQTATNLSVVDVATKQLQTWVPPILRTNGVGTITDFTITGGKLYFVGSFTSVGGQSRLNAAAITIGTGAVQSWNPSPNWGNNPGYSSLLVYGSNIILGGGFGPYGQDVHAGAIVDGAGGSLLKYLFTSNGSLFGNNGGALYWAAAVNSMAIQGNTLFAYSSGTYDTRVTAVDLTLSLPTSSTVNSNVLWMKYFNSTANARNMAVIGNSLYLAGDSFGKTYLTNQPNDEANFERKVRNIVRLNTATGNLENWFPDPVGQIYDDVPAMSVSGTNLFFGGRFSHVKGQDRASLVMIRNSTQTVLPFQINDTYGYYTQVGALKIAGDTLFVAGGLQSLSTTQYSSIAAYKLGTGARINWNPVNLGYVRSVAVYKNTVFVGGDLTEPSGGAGRTNLLAIDRQTGNLTSWAPNPDRSVYALLIRNSKLYVGGDYQNISGQVRLRLAAYDVNTLALTNWNPGSDGQVLTLAYSPGTIWAGGTFGSIGGSNRPAVASISEQTGAVNPPLNLSISYGVNNLITDGRYLLLGGGFVINNSSCNRLQPYDIYNQAPVSTTAFCTNAGEYTTVRAQARTGNDLYFGGDFTQVNGRNIATYIGRVRFPANYFSGPAEYITASNGSWFDPATWQGGLVPPVGANVTINHLVSLPATATSKRVKYGSGGSIGFSTGVSLKLGN